MSNFLVDPNGQPNSLYQYLMSELGHGVPVAEKVAKVRNMTTVIAETAIQRTRAVGLDDIVLIHTDDRFDLYHAIPRRLVEGLADVDYIIIDIHIIRCMSDDIDAGFYMRDPDAEFNCINMKYGDMLISDEDGKQYVCEDDGEERWCSNLTVLISVLEAFKCFQHALWELDFSGQSENYQIYIDSVKVQWLDGNSVEYCSIDAFIDDYLTTLTYQYDYRNWRRVYV